MAKRQGGLIQILYNNRTTLLVCLLIVTIVYGIYVIQEHKKLISEKKKPLVIVNRPKRINIRTRGNIGTWQKVGIAYSESHEDDTIYELWRKSVDTRRDRYFYKVVDKRNGISISLNNGDAMDRLDSRDRVDIIGKESLGQFVVEVDRPDELKYL